MFRVATEKDFLDAFRPRDRKHVELPPELKFPMIIQDYLAWVDPASAPRTHYDCMSSPLFSRQIHRDSTRTRTCYDRFRLISNPFGPVLPRRAQQS